MLEEGPVTHFQLLSLKRGDGEGGIKWQRRLHDSNESRRNLAGPTFPPQAAAEIALRDTAATAVKGECASASGAHACTKTHSLM